MRSDDKLGYWRCQGRKSAVGALAGRLEHVREEDGESLVLVKMGSRRGGDCERDGEARRP